MRASDLSLLAMLAWRNLWRHTRRTVVITFALTLGVWSMVALAALIRGSMESHIKKEFLNLTGHIQIHSPGYRDDPTIEHRFRTPPGLEQGMSRLSIEAWSTRVRVPAVISSERESAGVTLVGIDPHAERGLSFIAQAVRDGRYLESPGDTGLLLGRKLAERLETELGRRVVVMSQDANNQVVDRGFRVVGIFDAEPRAMETGFIFVGRRTSQDLLRIGADVSEIVVMTPDRDELAAVLAGVRGLAGDLEVAPWTEVQPLLVTTEKVNNVVLFIWFAVVFAAMAFGLVNTLLMAVFERTREFGLFQALGMPPRDIVSQVLIESLLLLVIGLVVGNAAAWTTVAGLRGGIDLSAFAEGFEMVGVSPIIYPTLAGADVVAANVVVVVFGLLASLYPAWRASRFVPVEAIART